MLYSIAEAAKATGLGETIILGALESGQIPGAQDHSGEWQVEDVEIHRLYLSIAQHFCKQKSQAGLQTADATASDTEDAPDSSDTNVGARKQHVASLDESTDGADQAKPTTTTPTWMAPRSPWTPMSTTRRS